MEKLLAKDKLSPMKNVTLVSLETREHGLVGVIWKLYRNLVSFHTNGLDRH